MKTGKDENQEKERSERQGRAEPGSSTSEKKKKNESSMGIAKIDAINSMP